MSRNPFRLSRVFLSLGVAAAIALPATAMAAPARTSHVATGRTLTMVATAYGPTRKDNYPYGAVDYYGKPLKAGDIAVDPRVIPLGTHLCVSGYHTPYLPAGGFCGVARDTGGAIKGNRIDIFINGTQQQVNSFGIQRVRVTLGG